MRQLRKKELKRFFKESIKRNQEIILILENIQYERNIAAIFRLADAAGIKKIYLTGTSKTPPFSEKMAHVSRRKEKAISWEYLKESRDILKDLRKIGFLNVAIEITNDSLNLNDFAKVAKGNSKICFVAGSEVYGIKNDTLKFCDESVYIPMYGKGGSLNVAMSLAVVLYAF
jgi:tRNA G18 (ribose-2'-O)-methylase SpoU